MAEITEQEKAVLDAAVPTIGSRIRITSTRVADGEKTVIEGVVEVLHTKVKPLAVELVNNHFCHIATIRQDVMITWEELEPAPPAAPPPPEPGPYLDKDGRVCEVEDHGDVRFPRSGRLTWATANERFGPFVRLVPVTDITELVDAAVMWRSHQGPTDEPLWSEAERDLAAAVDALPESLRKVGA